MQYVTGQAKKSLGFKERLLDWIDNFKVSIKNFFDFKYRRERKNKVLSAGELDRVPVERATFKDEKSMSLSAECGHKMKYVKTTGGAVVATPSSLRSIREDYKGAVIVDAAIKY